MLIQDLDYFALQIVRNACPENTRERMCSHGYPALFFLLKLAGQTQTCNLFSSNFQVRLILHA